MIKLDTIMLGGQVLIKREISRSFTNFKSHHEWKLGTNAAR